MKAIVTFLFSLCIFPGSLLAQPTVATNEYYHAGDVINMIGCDPSTINVGPSGSGITWDFSSLTATSGIQTTTVLHDTSSVFPLANILIIFPDGTRQHIQESNTDSYLQGQYDSSTSIPIYYNSCDIAQRPVTYLTVDTSDYARNIPTTHTTGSGRIVQASDAYGTLKLPTGTFNNVLRIKKVQRETDTTGTTILASSVISYLWFDQVHAAPLFRLDSTVNITGSNQRAMYYATPTAIKTVKTPQGDFTAYLDNHQLLLNGPFVNAGVYDVVVYNLIGTRVLTYEFAAVGTSQRFPVETQLYPGIYVVTITARSNPSAHETIKVVKQ